uniref:Tetratricopeptide repeat (TPR)-like superfamily protein n=1 Tax=Arabidopsis thaliana TaxID=3702 RepID=UPI002016A6E7|nr:Chain A, Tetratricopeptide repeat (TPR)-like superfamily protein [Arabidopsis thaliana]
NNAADSAATEVCDEEREKTLEFAEELTEKGSVFLKENDFAEAVDCFSRALEIRVAHYGELDAECINAYYRYGLALLAKAQAEADPLGNMPLSDADGDADEDESDLDMAWKMLDIARVITDKQSTETMEKVDILCSLAEVSLEREDIESSLSDYKNALSILERLVEPDSRRTAELNFRICICLETGCQPKEAIPYCQKALLICKARMERLSNEIKGASGSATSSSASDKEVEIGDLAGLAEDLEKKLEDLKQQAENPKQVLAELMGMVS